MGVLKLRAKQAEKLGLKPRSQLSPMLEKCCLCLCANESYQNAEAEIEALTGMRVGHSTHQRLVNRQELELPQAKQGLSEISLDGGKVRLRGELKAGSYWRDYKAIRLNGTYFGAFFAQNQSLIDYVNSHHITQSAGLLGRWSSRSLEFSSQHWESSTAVRNFGLVSSSRESLQSGWLTPAAQKGRSFTLAR